MDMNDFHNLTASDELKFVRHNDTDFNSFKSFQKRLDATFEEHEKAKAAAALQSRIRQWEEMLPPRWSGAKLKQIYHEHNPEAAKAIAISLKKYGPTSLFIRGLANSGKTYLAYATVRQLIGMGCVAPSQVKIISEEALMGFAGSGFEGVNRFNSLLDPRYTVYIFDGVGSRRGYSMSGYSQKEQQFWEQIIDHIYNHSLTAIFTSTKSNTDFASGLSDSAESKLAHLLHGRIIEAKGLGTSANHDAADAAVNNKKESEKYEGLWQS